MPIRNDELMNLIRSISPDDYQGRIPEVTRDNVQAIGLAMLTSDYEKQLNQFLDALVNRIGLVKIKDETFNNDLKWFKKGQLSYGTDIEEVFVDIINAIPFEGKNTDEPDQFEKFIPNVKSMFHRANRADVYPITITMEQLRNAFLTEGGLSALSSRIIKKLYDSDNYDEWILFKEMFTQYRTNPATPLTANQIVQVMSPETPGGNDGPDFYKALQTGVMALRFPTRQFNPANVMRKNSANELALFVKASLLPGLNVNVLARAFNMGMYSKDIPPIIPIDDFGSGLPNTFAVLMSREWPMVYDKLYEMRSAQNARGLYVNYFLHHWQVISASFFENIIFYDSLV